MVEQSIKFSKIGSDIIKGDIEIQADFPKEELFYKFIIGTGGIWNTIQEFSEKSTCIWKPKEEGKYIVMVQAKEKDSEKPYDFLAKEKFVVGNEEKEKLIKDIKIDSNTVTIGEKINISVIGSEEEVLYRFWIQSKQDWELVRDYTLDNQLTYTAIKEGTQEMLIECKRTSSQYNFDEFITIKFDVLPYEDLEITDFKCLSKDLLTNEDLSFKVDTNVGDKRSLLYKFVKIRKDGRVTCIQDYSSRRIVSFQETTAGEYKLLCLVKEILSDKEYDDRAVILYKVQEYKSINIKNFTPDINSPQINGTSITLRASATGGKELVYRYIIDGPIAEDSGYIRKNEYLWESKKDGEYKITLYVKDVSFEGLYEEKRSFAYSIDRKANRPAKITDVMVDVNNNTVLVGQPINMKVMAEGSINLQYSFIVYKDNKEVERVKYGASNWVNFTPEEKGNYDIEIRVKDKYSNLEYESNTYIYIKAKDYIPGEIDYIILPSNAVNIVGEPIEIETVVQNTTSILMRYVTKINNHLVEDTGFVDNKKIVLKPQCAGKYTITIYAKNTKADDEYDSKKEVSICVSEAVPVTGVTISSNKEEIMINEEVTFKASSKGGKEVCYEFYLMEKDNWMKVQSYGRKNYYTFIPFLRGEYRVMVFAKSFYKKVNYEDYCEFIFNVN